MARHRPQAALPWSAILDVRDPDGTRTRHPFRHPRVSIGRKKHNDLALADEAISGDHCELVAEAGFFLVRDLASANGTWVNEKRVGEARLRDGDELRIGGTRIRISLEGAFPKQPLRKLFKPRLAWVLGLGGLVLALAFGALVFRAAQETRLRDRYLAALREHLKLDSCSAAEASLAGLRDLEAQAAGRSLALSLDRGGIKLSKQDEKADLELLELYRRKLEVYAQAEVALTGAQAQGRESLEKLSRLGQRFGAAKDRRLAFYTEGLMKDRLQAGDELGQGVQELAAETSRLVGLVEAVVIRHEAPLAAQLAHFRFSAEPSALLAACRLASARAASGAGGALNGLED